MKYKPAHDLPKFAHQHNTLSPTELSKIILMRRNKDVRPQTISMWFLRNPTVYDQLKADILKEELPAVEVLPNIFRNGTFEEVASVKLWIEEMKSRDLVHVKDNVAGLKRACMGRFSRLKVDFVKEGLMCLKHPDRYTLKDAQELIKLMKDKGLETSSVRLPLRNFLMSKGINVKFKISGAKSKGFGKFADLYVEKPILLGMLDYIKELNYEVYAATAFMYKTGTRINATLKARVEHLRTERDGDTLYREITVHDKGRRSKHADGKPWKKHIDATLWDILKPLIGDREKGLVFEHVTESDCAKLNRAAIKQFIPSLNERIPMPNHFWRHMFFQHMLRATDWNYKIAAALGGSTAASVEESYGQPPRAIKTKWGLKYIPTI